MERIFEAIYVNSANIFIFPFHTMQIGNPSTQSSNH